MLPDLYNKLSQDYSQLLEDADDYDVNITELISHVQNYLIKEKNAWIKKNLIVVLNKSFQLVRCKTLRDYCLESTCADPESLFTSKYFLSLDQAIFLELIKRDELRVKEIDVWIRLIEWGIYNTPRIEKMNISDVNKFSDDDFVDLKRTLDSLIPHVRFYEISPKDFYSKIHPFQKVLPQSLYEDVLSFLMANTEPKYASLSTNNGIGTRTATRKHANTVPAKRNNKD
ncbi:2832_t:CDS:2, partial [Acaulospora colombiana]